MAHDVGAATTLDTDKTKKVPLEAGIYLTDVEIRQREIIVDVPKVVYHDVEYEKPIVKVHTIDTTKYNVVEQPTIKYIPKEEATIRYITKEVTCEKPVVITKEYVRPVFKDVEYERPRLVDKPVELATVKDIELVREYIKYIHELIPAIEALKASLANVIDYKLVEKVITVPKLEYRTVAVERIEWVPVKREVPNAD